MQWDGQRESNNVEDRRGSGGSGSGGGGLIGGLLGGRKIGIGTVVIALVASYFLGINPLTILGVLDGGAPQQQVEQPVRANPQEEAVAQHVRKTLGSTEVIWSSLFQATGSQYRPPKLVMFSNQTTSACGQGQAAMGPFYCPADQKVYIDLSFFQTLKNQLGAPGEFAQTYVIAHEVAHHVQHLLGISDKVDAQRGRISQVQQNALSVRLELQADCLSGVWAFHAQKDKLRIDKNDVELAMNAAAKIGDDALQRSSGGTVRPESFTHGSSAQRVRWFNTGLQSGDMRRCDTFNTRDL